MSLMAEIWNGIQITKLKIFSLSDIMDFRHQSSAMCIIMLGGEDTHPWSATKVGNPIPATGGRK